MPHQRPKTLLRLNASPYQREDFFRKEKDLAESWDMNYLFFDMKQGTLGENLPDPYGGPYIIISNTHTRPANVPKSILGQTRLWIHSNSGYDNFSVPWLKDQNFPLMTGNPIRQKAVTEYILGHLFSHFGSHPHQEAWCKERTWKRELLTEQSVLILGKGLIGSSVGKVLSPLVKKLTFWDPYKSEDPLVLAGEVEPLLKSHRIIILAASLNPSSMPLLNEERIESLSSDFLLINAARGGLVDQRALIKKLENCSKSFAYLDVFEKEPFGDEFNSLKNVHLTSHIAGVSKELESQILEFESEVLKHYFAKGEDSLKKAYTSLNLLSRIHEDYLI